MFMRAIAAVAALAVVFTTLPLLAESPKMKMTTEVPAGIAAPDQIETRFGTLEFADGFPTEATAPRGLASIVFAVMVAAQHLPGNDTILATVAWTIVLSVVAHGLTANFLASRFGARVDGRGGEL